MATTNNVTSTVASVLPAVFTVPVGDWSIGSPIGVDIGTTPGVARADMWLVGATRVTSQGGRPGIDPSHFIITSALGIIQKGTLAAGDNRVLIPTSATGVAIYIPENAGILTFKADANDTGISIKNSGWNWFTLHSSVREFTINSTIGITDVEVLWL